MKFIIAILGIFLSSAAVLADAADDAAAEALVKKSKCFGCHSLDKKKDGPSFQSAAAKYKGMAGAEAQLFTHLTTHPKMKVDGKEEAHDSFATKNEAEVKNAIGWILTR